MDLPSQRPILLDGACGTNLMQAGAPKDACLEYWATKHPQVVQDLLQAYVQAGSQIVYTPTFGANRVRLAEHGFQDLMEDINYQLAHMAKQAVGDRALVAGDIGPVGKPCAPFGELSFWDLIGIYAEQALALRDGGADLLVCETMMSLEELRAAILGARQAKLPILASMTIGQDGQTPFGSDPLACMVSVQDLGVVAFGLNCSDPAAVAEQLERLAPYASVPLIAKPNAGQPGAYRTPEELSAFVPAFAKGGARIFGGCCGSGPDHVTAIRQAMETVDFSAFPAVERDPDVIPCASEKEARFITPDVDVGETIECTPDLMEDILAAEEEAPQGALKIAILEEDDLDIFAENQYVVKDALCLWSDVPELLEKALRIYQGRAFWDGTGDLEEDFLRDMAKKYGLVLL